jgi:DNA-binding GntR family transcriptional regulator
MMEINSVSNAVADYLRLEIITGRLGSGHKVNEVHLASQLGISRPPLREALRILEKEHLVVSTPRKGTVVSEISIEDLREVYQVREMIECYAIDLIGMKIFKDLRKIESVLSKASDLPAPANDDPKELLQHLIVFADYHVKLIESTGNRRLVDFYRTIDLNLKRYQFMNLAIPGSEAKALEDHREILQLLKKNAYEKAKKIMRSHINLSLKSLEKKIEEGEDKVRSSA